MKTKLVGAKEGNPAHAFHTHEGIALSRDGANHSPSGLTNDRAQLAIDKWNCGSSGGQEAPSLNLAHSELHLPVLRTLSFKLPDPLVNCH